MTDKELIDKGAELTILEERVETIADIFDVDESTRNDEVAVVDLICVMNFL